jgi:hypothetical protein
MGSRDCSMVHVWGPAPDGRVISISWTATFMTRHPSALASCAPYECLACALANYRRASLYFSVAAAFRSCSICPLVLVN